MSSFPDNPTPDIGFSIYTSEGPDFHPLYYPSRFTITTEKELSRTSANCEGERVSVKKLKNSEIHITGRVHSSDMEALNALSESVQPVEVNTPALADGAMEAYVKSAERGDVVAYDAFPKAEEWMFEYTIDLVSTGRDEYEGAETTNGYDAGYDEKFDELAVDAPVFKPPEDDDPVANAEIETVVDDELNLGSDALEDSQPFSTIEDAESDDESTADELDPGNPFIE